MPRPKMPPMKKKLNVNTLKRVIKILFSYYPVLLPIAIACIIFSAVTAAIPAIFNQQVIAAIEEWFVSRDWASAKEEILPKIILLASLYVISLIAVTSHTQLMAYITQGFLGKMRKKIFDGMQNLPIRYFDTHKHGDIMSYYTNDIDTLRQLISQSIPALLQSSIIVIAVFSIMLWYSIWMTLVVLCGVIIMMIVSGKIGGGSAKYFIREQKAIG